MKQIKMSRFILLLFVFGVSFGDATQVYVRYPSELNPADVTYINGRAPDHLKAGPNSKFSAEFRTGNGASAQINTPNNGYIPSGNRNSRYEQNRGGQVGSSDFGPKYNQNQDYKHYVQSYGIPPTVQTISESSHSSPQYSQTSYVGSSSLATRPSEPSHKQSYNQFAVSSPVYQTNVPATHIRGSLNLAPEHKQASSTNIVNNQPKPIVEDTSTGSDYVQQNIPPNYNSYSKTIQSHPQISYQQPFYQVPGYSVAKQYPIVQQQYVPQGFYQQSARYPVNVPVVHSAYQPIQSHGYFVGGIQYPQFQQHHGIVQNPIDVPQPQPFIKTRKYEIRRPAIEKQFFDIEEHVIVRPAGSVVVELDGPVSKIPKGETITPIVVDSQSHGSTVSDQHNQNGPYESDGGVVSTTSTPHTIVVSSTEHNIHDSATPSPIGDGIQYADHQNPSISTPTITPESGIATTSYPQPLEEEDDSIVVEAGTSPNESIHYSSSTTESSATASTSSSGFSNSSNIHTNFTSNATPHMIAIGEPDFSYPPYVEINSHGSRSDVHDQNQGQDYNVGHSTTTATSAPIYYTTTPTPIQTPTPAPQISQHTVFFEKNNQNLVNTQVNGHANDQFTAYTGQTQPYKLVNVPQYSVAEIPSDSVQYQQHGCGQNHVAQVILPEQNAYSHNINGHDENRPTIHQNQPNGAYLQQIQQQPQQHQLQEGEQHQYQQKPQAEYNNGPFTYQQPQNNHNQVVKGSGQGYPSGVIYRDPKYNAAYTQQNVERPIYHGQQTHNGQVQKYVPYLHQESPQQLSHYQNSPANDLNPKYATEPVTRDDGHNHNIRVPIAHKQIIISSTPSSIPSQQKEKLQNYGQGRNEQSQKLIAPNHSQYEFKGKSERLQLKDPQVSQHYQNSPNLEILYDNDEQHNADKQNKYANLQQQNGPQPSAQLTLNNNNKNINDNNNENGVVHSRVISSTPAPINAKPASESVHTRRIVVNHPFETVQEIEIQEPETKLQQKLTVNQPNPYPTAKVMG